MMAYCGCDRWLTVPGMVGLSVLAMPAEGNADEAARGQDSIVQVPPEPSADGAWNERWPRVRWWEAAGSAALMSEAFAVRFLVEWDDEPNWQGGILLDDWVQDNLRAETVSTYDTWERLGDWAYFSGLAWAAIDPLVVGATSGDWDASSQMLLMNFEAYAIFASTLWTTQFFVRRERPRSAEVCEANPERASELGVSCSAPERHRSFIGGHTGVVATTASLTCLHHSQMDLYGDIGDPIACGTWITAAALTFASRTALGKHYFSDNLLGVGLGVTSGFLVPYLLHYGDEKEEQAAAQWRPEQPKIRGLLLRPTRDNAGMQFGVHGTL